jgi:hypothetical protein
MPAEWYSDDVRMLWFCGHVPEPCMWMVHIPSNGHSLLGIISSIYMMLLCSEIYILGFIVLCIHKHVGTTHKRGGTNIRYAFCCTVMCMLLAINMLWIVSDTAILTGFGHVGDGNNSDARPKPVLACHILSSCADLSRWYTFILWYISRGLDICVMQIFFSCLCVDINSHRRVCVCVCACDSFLHTRYPGQLGDAIPCMSRCCMRYECRVYVLRCGFHYWLHRVKKLLLYISVCWHLSCFFSLIFRQPYKFIPTECWIQLHDMIISVLHGTYYIYTIAAAVLPRHW